MRDKITSDRTGVSRKASFNVQQNHNIVAKRDEHTEKVKKALSLDISDGLFQLQNQEELQAELIIDGLITGIYTFSRLDLDRKRLLFKYIYKYNQTVNRSISLHVNLPVSSFRIQKPTQVKNEILQDYVYNFYTRMLESIEFKRLLMQLTLSYWIYGRGDLLIEDDYPFLRDTIVDDTDLENMIKIEKGTEEDQEFIDTTTKKYTSDKASISLEDKLKLVKLFKFDLNPAYKGVIKAKVIKPTDIKKRETNDEIDFSILSLDIPNNVKPAYSRFSSEFVTGYNKKEDTKALKEFYTQMKRIGYTEGYIRAALKSSNSTIEVDNDPYNNKGHYFKSLCSVGLDEDDNSILNAILEPAIDLIITKRRAREKVNASYKKNNIVSMPNADADSINALKLEVDQASGNPEGYTIFTNQDVNVQEVTLDTKDRVDLTEVKEDSTKDLMIGMGMPDTLLNGGDSYSSSFLKIELLTNEYTNYRRDIANFVEKHIFKPISIRKGFVTKDDWGEPVVVYPFVKFDKLSIARGTEDFNFIAQQVDANRLPVSSLIETMGYDVEEVKSELRDEMTSVFNSAVRDAVTAALSELSSPMAQTKELVNKLAETLSIPDLKNAKPKEEE